MSSICKKTERLLSLYIDGELSEKKQELVKNHLEACPQCQKSYNILLTVCGDLKKISSEPLPDGFKQSLHLRLAAEGQPKHRKVFGAVRPFAAAAVSCAVIAAVAIGTGYYQSFEKSLNEDLTYTKSATSQADFTPETKKNTDADTAEPSNVEIQPQQNTPEIRTADRESVATRKEAPPPEPQPAVKAEAEPEQNDVAEINNDVTSDLAADYVGEQNTVAVSRSSSKLRTVAEENTIEDNAIKENSIEDSAVEDNAVKDNVTAMAGNSDAKSFALAMTAVPDSAYGSGIYTADLTDNTELLTQIAEQYEFIISDTCYELECTGAELSDIEQQLSAAGISLAYAEADSGICTLKLLYRN